MKPRVGIVLSLLFMFAISPCVCAQPAAATACTLPTPTFVTGAPNIFNDRQEQDLGDALAESAESDMLIAPPAKDDELTRIGERLLSALPPTGIHYRFRVYDSGEVNGFSLAGGRVYISRKLIAAVQNEDELAGVLAHEIGHLSTHQTAIEFTRLLRDRLGVTQVTDRADVFAKVHQLMSTPAKGKDEEDTERKDQMVADQVALYAMVRAGYQAESFASFMNQSMMNKGKTGNWVSDLFGLTHEETQRYRSALKLIGALAPECRGKQPATNEVFTAWQSTLINERVKDVAEGVTGDKPLNLDPPLRPSLTRIRFSPNGRYLLAQDDGSITLVDRNAQKALFLIEAPEAELAQFTPDSSSVVFNDRKLRVERWDVATARRTMVKELVVYDGCDQTQLSPDGKTLVCAKVDAKDGNPRIGLRLFDVDSGTPFFEKPNFFQMNPMSYSYSNYLAFVVDAMLDVKMVVMRISPDSHYLLLSVGAQSLAYDLAARRPISLGGKLRDLVETNMTFIGSGELFMEGDVKKGQIRHGLLLSFPDGKVIKDIDIGSQEVEGVTKGNAMIAGPLEDYAVGLVDFDKGGIVALSKLAAMDAWDNMNATEDPAGGLQLVVHGVPGSTKILLPLGPLPGLHAAAISPDGAYLAISMRNRAEIWSLETGKQVRIMRPIRSLWFDGNDRLWMQLPKYAKRDPVEMRIGLKQPGDVEFGKFAPEDSQYGNLQLRLRPMGKDKNVRSHATLEVKAMETQKVMWTRDYQHETPACWPADDDRMVLAWDLSNDAAKAEIKNYPQLQKQVEAFKDRKKGLLLETVTPETGAALEQVVIPEADLSGGWNDERRAWVSGKFVLVRGEHGNTVIYHLDGSGKVGEFFGSPLETDAQAGVIAAINRDDEVLLVDQRTGKELKRFTLGSPIRLARIIGSKDKTLFILTADQVVHRLPL